MAEWLQDLISRDQNPVESQCLWINFQCSNAICSTQILMWVEEQRYSFSPDELTICPTHNWMLVLKKDWPNQTKIMPPIGFKPWTPKLMCSWAMPWLIGHEHLHVKSVKCYHGGRKIDLIPSISDIQSWYRCVHYAKRHLMSLISYC